MGLWSTANIVASGQAYEGLCREYRLFGEYICDKLRQIYDEIDNIMDENLRLPQTCAQIKLVTQSLKLLIPELKSLLEQAEGITARQAESMLSIAGGGFDGFELHRTTADDCYDENDRCMRGQALDLRDYAQEARDYVNSLNIRIVGITSFAPFIALKSSISDDSHIVLLSSKIEQAMKQEYMKALERVRSLLSADDVKWFNKLLEMNTEVALNYIRLFEAVVLALPQDIDFPHERHYLEHMIQHMRNRVYAEDFIERLGEGREFTEEEVLLLGVILRLQKIESINLNRCIKEQYIAHVSPLADGLSLDGIPDHLVPLYMYPTQEMQDIFLTGRFWAPVASAALFAFAGMGDMSKNFTAAMNMPPTKPRADYIDVHRTAHEGGINISQKPTVSNERLQNIVNNLYKGQGGQNTVGNGTTMDAVRNEIKTGNPTNGRFHTQKLNESLTALQRRLRAGNLNAHDKAVINVLIEDIVKALSGR